MFIAHLFENKAKRIIVTYPGRFQPFHKGHREVFASLQRKFGSDNVFIITSNNTDGVKSPFNFGDKIRFMHAMGVPDNQVIESSKVYDLPAQFESIKDQIIFITAIGQPDEKRLQPGRVKKDGSPGFFQPVPNDSKDFKTADEHGYVIIAPEYPQSINIGGQSYDASHGTQTRELWNQVRDNPEQRKEFLQQLYGRTDPELGHILDKIPHGTPEPVEPPAAKMKNAKKDLVKVSTNQTKKSKTPKQDAVPNNDAQLAEDEFDEDSYENLHLHYKKNRFKAMKKTHQLPEDDVEEGWKSKAAGAALAAANLLGAPAQASEPVKPITIATVIIDGEVRQYNLGDKFSNAREAEKFITNVLNKQGLSGYALEIRHGYPKNSKEKTNEEPLRREMPVTKPEPLSPEKRQELEQQLADLERVFDRDYEYSDDHRVWTKHRDIAARIGNIKRMLATESQIAIGDIVTVTAGPMTNLSGIVESFGYAGKFVVVDIHNQDKISVPVACVAVQEADDHSKHLGLDYKKNRFKTLKKTHQLPEDDVEESLYQYDKADPYNSEFAPDVGMGRMTLRGWKQSMIRRVKEFAAELERNGEHLDNAAMWEHVYKKLKNLNLDPIAQEIELAHQELERIRRQGGIRSRAFKK